MKTIILTENKPKGWMILTRYHVFGEPNPYWEFDWKKKVYNTKKKAEEAVCNMKKAGGGKRDFEIYPVFIPIPEDRNLSLI